MKKIILASTSLRRKEIFEKAGLRFAVVVSEYEEDMTLRLKPRELARYLSMGKARAVAKKHKSAIVIAADTFISYKGKVLGKPHTADQAGKMLRMLSGKVHSVITGFTVIDASTGKKISRAVETKVYFKKLTKEEIAGYIKSKEPLDKAGAYAIQGLGAVLVEKLEGDFFNVMGLPLNALVKELKTFGINVLK